METHVCTGSCRIRAILHRTWSIWCLSITLVSQAGVVAAIRDGFHPENQHGGGWVHWSLLLPARYTISSTLGQPSTQISFPGRRSSCSHVLLLWGESKIDPQSLRGRRWRALGNCVQLRALDHAWLGTTGYGSSTATALAWQTLQQNGWGPGSLWATGGIRRESWVKAHASPPCTAYIHQLILFGPIIVTDL